MFRQSTDDLLDDSAVSVDLKFSPVPSGTSSSGSLSAESSFSGRDFADATLNLVNSIIGGGMLALPFALRNCGVLFGALLILGFFFLSWYTGVLMTRVGSLGHGTTVADMSQAAFGTPGRVLAELSIILSCFGATVGYLVIVGDVMSPYVNLLFPVDRRLVILFFGLLVCFPLSCLRRISLLRFTSFVALVFILYLVALIVYWSAAGMAAGQFDADRVVLFSLDAQFLAVLPIISFAFSFQQSVPLIWADMAEFKVGGRRNIDLAIFVSCAMCLVVYLLAGIFGYLSFFEGTSDNILTHYPAALWFFDLGKIGYACIIMFSYPLLAFPIRASVDALINTYYFKEPERVASALRLVLEAAIIFAASFGLAALNVGIGVVFGLSGATVGNLILIGFPTTLFIALERDPREGRASFVRPWWFYRIFSFQKLAALLIFLLSLVLTATGLLSIIAFNILGGFEESLSQT